MNNQSDYYPYKLNSRQRWEIGCLSFLELDPDQTLIGHYVVISSCAIHCPEAYVNAASYEQYAQALCEA